MEQLLRREGRCVPVSPTPRIADPALPPPVRRAPPVAPPPEHGNVRAAAAAPLPQTALPVAPRPDMSAVTPGIPGPTPLLTVPLALPPGGQRSHRRRPPARRPLVVGAAVAGAAMFVGSVASSALPDRPGQPTTSPPLGLPAPPSSPVGSSGTVTLGAAALEAAPAPISGAAPELVVPSINPPPLGPRARPLQPGPVILAAAPRAEPETSSRSTMATPSTVAPDDRQVPEARTTPPASAERSAEPLQQDAPDDAAPDDAVPAESAPENSAPENSAPAEGAPGHEDAPDSSVPDEGVSDASGAAADQGDPQRGSGDEGGRHRR
ncbi:MAG: hypothetical protein ACRDSL_22570 [Pseudonocardiaceae bacterium]